MSKLIEPVGKKIQPDRPQVSKEYILNMNRNTSIGYNIDSR